MTALELWFVRVTEICYGIAAGDMADVDINEARQELKRLIEEI